MNSATGQESLFEAYFAVLIGRFGGAKHVDINNKCHSHTSRDLDNNYNHKAKFYKVPAHAVGWLSSVKKGWKRGSALGQPARTP